MRSVLATWNIYWLGAVPPRDKGARTGEDLQTIAKVIRRASPDLLALQEIVDPEILKEVLGFAGEGGREYVIEAEGRWLTSADESSADPSLGWQKVFFCYDRRTLTPRRWAPLHSPGARKPLAVDFWHEPSSTGFTAVAVHLQAGHPYFTDSEDAGKRRREAAALMDWLMGRATKQNPAFPEPGYEKVIVLGDFNAELNRPGELPRDPHGSLDPLRELEAAGWSVRDPDPDGERWRTTLFGDDRYVIDLMLLSPAMSDVMSEPPRVYAWGVDPGLGGPDAFRHNSAEFGRLKSYAVSDHRMVRAAAEF